jgi:hypothetical protein
MSCILRIEGEEFKLDEFLSILKTQPYEKHKKGEQSSFKNKKKLFHKKNGCKFDLSSAEFNEFEKQKRDVLSFLEQNFFQLNRLQEFGLLKSDVPEIDFAINLNPDYSVEGFSIDPELSKLAADLNFSIMMSIYTI